jgi:Universal stress protein family
MAATIEARSTAISAKQSPVTGVPYPVPVKRILVPTDLSAASLKGVAYAVKIAQHFDAELTICTCSGILHRSGRLPEGITSVMISIIHGAKRTGS